MNGRIVAKRKEHGYHSWHLAEQMKALPFVALFVLAALDTELDRRLEEVASRARLPGFAVAVVTKDSVLFQKGYGWADIEKKVRYTPQSLQNIGSITKTFIGVSLMQLVEQNRLRLDDDVNRYLPFKLVNPHFPDDTITIRQVATHRATLTDTDDFWRNDYVLSPSQPVQRGLARVDVLRAGNTPMPMDQFIRQILAPGGKWYRKDNFLKQRPGTTFQYSNLGAAVAAHIVERVTGESFAEYTARHIFKPIGMSQTGWSFEQIDINQYVTQYVSNMKIVPRYSLISYPDGGLITSVDDLSRYLMEMMKGYQGESRLLRRESFREMMAPDWWKPGAGGYNIFWTLRSDGSLGHGGGDPGTTTSMFFYPARNIGAIVFTNYTFGDGDAAQRQFQDVVNALVAEP
jgi:CubicO group peptidase (beta-lactamase class C family)